MYLLLSTEQCYYTLELLKKEKYEQQNRIYFKPRRYFSIVAKDEDFPHIVNTWNTFVIFKDNNLFVPVGGMNKMEEILEKDNRIIVVIGTRELMGLHGPGIGIKIIGKAIIDLSTVYRT